MQAAGASVRARERALEGALREAYARGDEPTAAVQAFLGGHPRARTAGAAHLLQRYALRVTWPQGGAPPAASEPCSVAQWS